MKKLKNKFPNCYSAAIGKRSMGRLQPGELSGLPPLADSEFNAQNIKKRILKDGSTQISAKKAAKLKKGVFAVKFTDKTSKKQDYHCLYKNRNGNYEGVVGDDAIMDRDDNLKPIKNPQTAPTNKYKKFIGFFRAP